MLSYLLNSSEGKEAKCSDCFCLPAPELVTILQCPASIFLSCVLCVGVRNFDSHP